jgi:hypothetical protein
MAAEAAMRRAEVFMIGSSLGGSGLVYTSALGSCVCWKAEVIRLVMIQNRLPKKRAWKNESNGWAWDWLLHLCDDGEKERKEMGYMRTLYTS